MPQEKEFILDDIVVKLHTQDMLGDEKARNMVFLTFSSNERSAEKDAQAQRIVDLVHSDLNAFDITTKPPVPNEAGLAQFDFRSDFIKAKPYASQVASDSESMFRVAFNTLQNIETNYEKGGESLIDCIDRISQASSRANEGTLEGSLTNVIRTAIQDSKLGSDSKEPLNIHKNRAAALLAQMAVKPRWHTDVHSISTVLKQYTPEEGEKLYALASKLEKVIHQTKEDWNRPKKSEQWAKIHSNARIVLDKFNATLTTQKVNTQVIATVFADLATRPQGYSGKELEKAIAATTFPSGYEMKKTDQHMMEYIANILADVVKTPATRSM